MKRQFPVILGLAVILFAHAGYAHAAGLVFKFHMEQKTVTGTAAPVVSQADYVVALFPQMVDVRADGIDRIYDVAQRQFYAANLAQSKLTTYSLYAIPLGKNQDKRAALRALFEQQKVANPALTIADVKDVDVDMLYGSQNDTKTSDLIKTAEAEGKTSLSAQGHPLADFTLSDVSVPDAFKASYAHFFLYETALHPVISRQISSAGKVFKSLHYITHGKGQTAEFTLTFTSSYATDLNGPTINNYKPTFTGNDLLDAAITKTGDKPIPTAQQLDAKIAGFTQQKDPLRAALAAKEMELTLGADAAQDSAAARAALASDDALTSSFVKDISGPSHSTDDFVRDMQLFNQLDGKAADYAYLVELFRANQIRAILESRTNRSPDEDNAIRAALEKLSGAIIANPWLTEAYCDLGDAYFNALQPRIAWVLWDQAIRLNPKHPALQHVDTLQTQALKDFPEYF